MCALYVRMLRIVSKISKIVIVNSPHRQNTEYTCIRVKHGQKENIYLLFSQIVFDFNHPKY